MRREEERGRGSSSTSASLASTSAPTAEGRVAPIAGGRERRRWELGCRGWGGVGVGEAEGGGGLIEGVGFRKGGDGGGGRVDGK